MKAYDSCNLSHISIHALLWSATEIIESHGRWLRFLSTHSCGVRQCANKKDRPAPTYFYPRTPVECDWRNPNAINPETGISIHALLWSAT